MYTEHASSFLRPLSFPEDVLDGMDMSAMLNLSTLRVDEASSRLGAHRDPACPMPALIGNTHN